MSLLLDTHVVLWWLTDSPDLSPVLKKQLDHEADVFISVASLWEVAIKQALGKLSGPENLPGMVRDSGFRNLPILADHAIEAGALPPIHRDPFDRLLVAQARLEELRLVTRDPLIRRYDVEIEPA